MVVNKMQIMAVILVDHAMVGGQERGYSGMVVVTLVRVMMIVSHQ
jgi:hypothetical protein